MPEATVEVSVDQLVKVITDCYMDGTLWGAAMALANYTDAPQGEINGVVMNMLDRILADEMVKYSVQESIMRRVPDEMKDKMRASLATSSFFVTPKSPGKEEQQ